MLISLTKKKDIHTHQHTTSDQTFLLSSIMSYDDSVHWHGRAKEMLARAEQMNEGVTKNVLRRLADAYEGLARKADKQAKRFPPNPVSQTPLPAEARQFSLGIAWSLTLSKWMNTQPSSCCAGLRMPVNASLKRPSNEQSRSHQKR
jgi:hypothetical protein